MKLINGQKKANFLKTENNKVLQVTAEEIKEFPQTYMIAAFSDGVSKGIEFAESELKNLAIDFTKWCGKRYFYNENSYVWVLGSEKYTTEALFEKFIEQRSDA